MGKILFGAAYYPEYLPCERTEEDMRMMRRAGINTIRIAESTWSTLEPEEGHFDFSVIDRVLDAANRWEMSVIIGTPTYAIPPWLAKKDPEILVETREGRARYGHRQVYDLTNPVYLEACERVIRALLRHTAAHPRVIGFQIDNETKHFNVSSRRVQQRFVDELKKTFQTTEALNRAFCLSYWSNSVADWEDFPDMNGCVNAGLACEFERFQRKLAVDFLEWQAALVREYRREDQFITHNLDFSWKKFGAQIAQDGYSYGVQPEMDHLAASRCLTLAGTDIYHPTQDESTGAEVAFCGDSIRSLKHAPYLVLETQAQAFKEWTPYPGQLTLDMMSHLSGGALGVLYWNWHSIHNGYEAYWRGILSHDLGENPAYAEICRIGEILERAGAEHLCIEKKNQIALVTDHHSLAALNWYPTDSSLSYNDVVRWVYDSLYEMNLECDVVDVNALEPERYRMIVLPQLYSASERTIFRLKEFVRQGGVLLATFRSFFSDEHLRIYPDLQPHGMTDCFGASYSQFTAPGTTLVDGEKVSYFMELLSPDTAEALFRYEHRYWGDYAAVTRNRFGQGTAWYVGCFLPKPLLQKILLRAADDAGISPPSLRWPLVMRKGKNRLGRNVAYVMNFSAQERKTPCPFARCRELVSGEVYTRGEMLFLKDWGALVLEEM